MNVFGDPDNAVFRVAKAGTLSLLTAVDRADKKGAKAKASKTHPPDAVRAYLDASFLGPFLRSEVPYLENAGVLGTYIDFLDHELERGALHATPLHQVYLKLLAYVTAIEASAPLSLFGNCLEFLAGTRRHFNFGLYYGMPSANKKLEAVSAAVKSVGKGRIPQAFSELHSELKKLINPTFRNAIAHATYRVRIDDGQVDIWKDGRLVESRTFAAVDQSYKDARCWLIGFTDAISDFARGIHPDCPYAWHP